MHEQGSDTMKEGALGHTSREENGVVQEEGVALDDLQARGFDFVLSAAHHVAGCGPSARKHDNQWHGAMLCTKKQASRGTALCCSDACMRVLLLKTLCMRARPWCLSCVESNHNTELATWNSSM